MFLIYSVTFPEPNFCALAELAAIRKILPAGVCARESRPLSAELSVKKIRELTCAPFFISRGCVLPLLLIVQSLLPRWTRATHYRDCHGCVP